MQDKKYCSLQSPGISMVGTADPVDVWLLLEYPMSWGSHVTDDNQLAEPIQNWLHTSLANLRAAGVRVRPQFIRQPEFDRKTTKLMLLSEKGSWQFEGQGYDYLLDLDVELFLRSPESCDLPSEPSSLLEAQYFVCMNGQRDICCARFGRPIYQKLLELAGSRVWQVSHLGGHRYAPNVLCAPQGTLYGRLQLENVTEFFEQTESGLLNFEALRGRSWYSKEVQAAEIFAARQNLKLVSQQDGDNGETQVRFTLDNSSETMIDVAMRKSAEPIMALASCGDSKEKPVYPYECLEVKESMG